MSHSSLRGLNFIQSGLNVVALFSIVSGVAVPVLGLATTGLATSLAIGLLIFFTMLGLLFYAIAHKLIKRKRWAYYVTLILSFIIAAYFVVRLVLSFVLEPFNSFSLGLFLVGSITLFFSFSAYYLLRPDVRIQFK